ncbi:MAG: DNA polymerase III subunit delta [Hyphomicrobiaceae bacterium]
MVSVKAGQASAFARKPPDGCVAALVFGSDAGSVSERSTSIARAFAARQLPVGEIIRIEDQDLEADPDRLLVELQTIPMFGGQQVVRTTLGRRVPASLLKSLLDDGPPAAHLVVQAGNLKASDAARKAFESTAWAAAVPCYPDSERDINDLITEVTQLSGLSIDRQAREALVERLGGDRAASRGEIDKLTLYCATRDCITLADIEAIVGDASEIAIDVIVQAAASGQADTALKEFDRAMAAGENAQVLIGALQRHFKRLHHLRTAIDAGKSFEDAARNLRPPIFFKQKSAMGQQSRLWTVSRLQTALQRISGAATRARRSSNMETILAERLLFELARSAASTRSNQSRW